MTPKILIADSSNNFRLVLKNRFNAYDCEFIEADNGKTGLALAVSKRPDLIILDVDMPVMTGGEMLRKLKSREEFKDIPVIIVSAESEQSKVLEYAKLGVQGYFVKPLRGDELMKRVKKLLSLPPRKAYEPTSDAFDAYFSVEGDILFLKIPDNVTKRFTEELEGNLHSKLIEVTNTGILKFVLDLSQVSLINIHLIKLTVATIKKCQKSHRRFRVVADPNLGKELSAFSELANISFAPSIKEAMTALGST